MDVWSPVLFWTGWTALVLMAFLAFAVFWPRVREWAAGLLMAVMCVALGHAAIASFGRLRGDGDLLFGAGYLRLGWMALTLLLAVWVSVWLSKRVRGTRPSGWLALAKLGSACGVLASLHALLGPDASVRATAVFGAFFVICWVLSLAGLGRRVTRASLQ